MPDTASRHSPKAIPPKQARKPSLTVSRPELLINGSDQQFRSLVHNLFAFFARHSAIREGHAAVIGLAGIEYTILISIRHLSVARGDVGVRDVAEHLHLSGAFTTTVTNKLMSKGLIDKVGHPVDKRRLCLSLTACGNELLDRLAPTQRQVNDVQFEDLSSREFLQLLELVERLVKSSDRAVALQRYLAEGHSHQAVSKMKPTKRGKRK